MIKYYHPCGTLKDGKIFCNECGMELDRTLMSEKPCSVPTANRLLIDDYIFEISVWNCKADLLVFKEDEKGKRRYFTLKGSEKVMERLEELVLASIYECGGAVNFSGLYPLNDDLVEFLEDSLKTGKLEIVGKRKERKTEQRLKN